MLTAPTGRAAQRLSTSCRRPGEGRTIHSYLSWRKKDEEKEPAYNITDESSMMDSKLAYRFLRKLPLKTGITFVGDHGQLPSINMGNFFGDIIESGVIPCASLTEIIRQVEGATILKIAEKVRKGISVDLEKEKDESSGCYAYPSAEPTDVGTSKT